MKLILMPGMDGTGLFFRPLLDALPREASTQVLAYPGFELNSYSTLLPLIRRALPTSEKYILVAESYSGPLALMIGAECPVGMCGIVLSASFVQSPAWWAPKSMRHLVVGPAFTLFPAFTRAKALLGGYSSPALRALSREVYRLVSASVLAARVRETLAVDVVSELRACQVPILYIRGTNDNVVPERCLRVIQRERPDVQTVSFPAPHMVLQARPNESVQAICRFAAEAGAV